MTAVDRIYDSLVCEETYALLPATLAEAVKARSCVMQRFDPAGVLQEIGFSYFTDEMNLYYGANEIFRSDIWASTLNGPAQIGRAAALGDIVGDRSYRASIFYNDFIRHFGDDTGQCVGIGFRSAEGGLVAIGFHRAFTDRAFPLRSLATINRLKPHLNRLLQLRGKLRQAEIDAQLARAGFDAVDQAVILADEFARPLLVNRAAEHILADADGLGLRRGRLEAAGTRAQRTLERAVYSAARRTGDRGGACLIERPSGKRPLRVVVAPLGLSFGSCALLLIDDPERQPSTPAADLSRLFGLTAAEAQTALALGKGLTPEDVAEQRAVSLATIRTQIQSVFRKTDTHRIPELALLLARLPRRPLE